MTRLLCAIPYSLGRPVHVAALVPLEICTCGVSDLNVKSNCEIAAVLTCSAAAAGSAAAFAAFNPACADFKFSAAAFFI